MVAKKKKVLCEKSLGKVWGGDIGWVFFFFAGGKCVGYIAGLLFFRGRVWGGLFLVTTGCEGFGWCE